MEFPTKETTVDGLLDDRSKLHQKYNRIEELIKQAIDEMDLSRQTSLESGILSALRAELSNYEESLTTTRQKMVTNFNALRVLFGRNDLDINPVLGYMSWVLKIK